MNSDPWHGYILYWSVNLFLMQVVFFSAATTVISEVTVPFCISMRKLTSVKIIKRRDTSNCSASTASSDKCQYVWCHGLSMTLWPHIPVNANQSRNICTCSALNPLIDMWQYVVVFVVASQCVDVDTCQKKTMKTESETLSN